MSIYEKYETVIGLEVHAQLLTKSKAYSNDPNSYGEAPNSNVSAISLGHPGTLPKMNKSAIEYAIKMGYALKCTINKYNEFARKNYFYADLPKGYQITQDTTPICTDGSLKIVTEAGTKTIGITRIHMEEDSGKSIHDQDPYYSLVDLNRAGVPLIEIVSEPDMTTSDDAYAYLTEIRKLVRYLDICDGNMEEGSLRCDANVSVRPLGQKEFGVKVEVKNMNSIRNVKRALEFEVKRQIDDIEAGKEIFQETRSFDAVNGSTFSMRSKEMANDYRYFPEPDLPPVVLTESYLDEIRSRMPALPEELFEKYTKEFGLNEYDAGVITDDKQIAAYFDELVKYTKNYKSAANWVQGAVKSYLNENALGMEDFNVPAKQVAALIELIDNGDVSNSAASQKLFPALVKEPQKEVSLIAKDLNLIQESDSDYLQDLIDQAIKKHSDKVEVYRSGQKGLLGLFMGEVMKLSGGKADPKVANELLVKKLNQD